MNRYGQLAMDRMRALQPGVLAGIEDPDSFFSRLGEELERQVDRLEQQITGPVRPGETYLERLARRREARITAESEVTSWVGAPAEGEPTLGWPAATVCMAVVGAPDPDDPSCRQGQELRG